MSIFWAYVRFRILLWLLKLAGRVLLAAALVAVLVAAAPVTIVAGVGLAGACDRAGGSGPATGTVTRRAR